MDLAIQASSNSNLWLHPAMAREREHRGIHEIVYGPVVEEACICDWLEETKWKEDMQYMCI